MMESPSTQAVRDIGESRHGYSMIGSFPTHSPNRQGLTLIELMVAVALSTLLVMALSGLTLAFSRQLRVAQEVAERLTSAEQLAGLLERDLVVAEYWRVTSQTVDLRITSGVDVETGAMSGGVQVLRYRTTPQGLLRERLMFEKDEWQPRESLVVAVGAREVLAGPADHNQRELRALSALQDVHWKPVPHRFRLLVLNQDRQVLAEGSTR